MRDCLTTRRAETIQRRRRSLVVALTLGSVLSGLAFGQSTTTGTAAFPKEHPPANRTDRRDQASQLTEAVAGSERGSPAAAVPRKNFIDQFIFGKMERDGIPHAALAGDGEFFRRVHLDLTGRIPDPEQLNGFVGSTDPQKREKLVDSLLHSPAYLAKWTYWFGDRGGLTRTGSETTAEMFFTSGFMIPST